MNVSVAGVPLPDEWHREGTRRWLESTSSYPILYSLLKYMVSMHSDLLVGKPGCLYQPSLDNHRVRVHRMLQEGLENPSLLNRWQIGMLVATDVVLAENDASADKFRDRPSAFG